jgi:hypothetical protein
MSRYAGSIDADASEYSTPILGASDANAARMGANALICHPALTNVSSTVGWVNNEP